MAEQKPDAANANPAKDPDEWVTGDEPMTGPQRSYVGTLSREAGEPVDENLTKAEASKKIEQLQEKTGRGSQAPSRRRGRTGPRRGRA
jgi:hypothetical protein